MDEKTERKMDSRSARRQPLRAERWRAEGKDAEAAASGRLQVGSGSYGGTTSKGWRNTVLEIVLLLQEQGHCAA